MYSLGLVGAFVLGAVVGSFANVCIYRLPRRQSLIAPGSSCPFCLVRIPPWHNVPLLSFLLLGGRCAACQARISWRYPLVEGLCGLLYAGLFWQWAFSPQAAVAAALVTALLIVSFIDLDYQIVPDAITLPGIGAGLLASAWLTPVGLGNAFLGAGLGGGLLLLVALLSRGGMGGGDIKLLAMVGAFLGWRAVLVTVFLGALSGAVVGIALILLGKKKRKEPIPFGPFLSLGALVALFWGERLLAWYFRLSP
ncbi:MAG: type 4 prepilin-like proteins leader peptide-processing enzyme [Candidatus Tectimicrobiota bacterium]|nr:MAG: type 4 prepilin-like proteins leader peptide-processing enzyme [Candidatus Tectomicrobia bacterium]